MTKNTSQTYAKPNVSSICSLNFDILAFIQFKFILYMDIIHGSYHMGNIDSLERLWNNDTLNISLYLWTDFTGSNSIHTPLIVKTFVQWWLQSICSNLQCEMKYLGEVLSKNSSKGLTRRFFNLCRLSACPGNPVRKYLVQVYFPNLLRTCLLLFS